jgi:hypothetical protein
MAAVSVLINATGGAIVGSKKVDGKAVNENEPVVALNEVVPVSKSMSGVPSANGTACEGLDINKLVNNTRPGDSLFNFKWFKFVMIIFPESFK